MTLPLRKLPVAQKRAASPLVWSRGPEFETPEARERARASLRAGLAKMRQRELAKQRAVSPAQAELAQPLALVKAAHTRRVPYLSLEEPAPATKTPAADSSPLALVKRAQWGVGAFNPLER